MYVYLEDPIDALSFNAVSSTNAAGCFLDVQPGDYVLVEECSQPQREKHLSRWIGQVLISISGARDPSINSLFQVLNIDTGAINIINADLVKGILKKAKR